MVQEDKIPFLLKGMTRLLQVVQDLSLARDIHQIADIVRHAARELTGADGATFVLREENLVYYADEDAIGPLWKGKRFPMESCISGWAILHKEHVIIEDIYRDSRVPIDAYQPTFVKSLAMMPVRRERPIAAIGNYWAAQHLATPEEIQLLQALADSTSVAIENVQLFSDTQRALEQARNATKELSRQLELRDEFISVAAHELRTPLTALNLQKQFMRGLIDDGMFDHLPRFEELKRFSEIRDRQLTQLTERIESLVDVSHIRLGEFKVNRTQRVDLHDLVRQTVNACEDPASEIRLKFSETVVQGFWDRDYLARAIRNILNNALRYGEGKPIEVTVSQDKKNATLEIRDFGIGIDGVDHNRLFDRFERASSMKNYGGMGLGLFITRQIVLEHGGNITMSSQKGQGTSVRIELPLSA